MTEQPYILGIDVSHHQDPAKLNYPELKRQGYQWVIVRATYGTRPDKFFVDHYNKAKSAGLLVGAYHFFRQKQGADEQLQAFVDQMQKVELDIIPVIDLEWNTAFDGEVERDLFNTKGREMVETIKALFGDCLLYLAPGFFQTLGSPDWLLQYPWWVAHYTKDAKPWAPFKEDWSIWQYTGAGSLPTVYDGDLDLNRARKVPLIADYKPTPETSTPEESSLEGCIELIKQYNVELSDLHLKLAKKYLEYRDLLKKESSKSR